MINGEAMELIREVGCGKAVLAEDAEAFATAILEMSAYTAQERAEMGMRGKEYAAAHFDFAKQMTLLEDIMR